ncbi:hypothetical protein GCM10007147_41640 [Nocardiopsis kunsanensis]|uniref:Thiocillin family RiPP n=1 Tax=Nocardiopsis kunsanensis TaxID=141693 RepID=A0A918XJI2_9ACTN|nr:hypothetical protein [Nocardiopsis kunsanensis]GHD35294.1 hypothetical protein GCM10007147_41640 [Nocardiopsis kunsanensis]
MKSNTNLDTDLDLFADEVADDSLGAEELPEVSTGNTFSCAACFGTASGGTKGTGSSFGTASG